MKRCETCQRNLLDKTMRFCPRHAMAILKQLEASDYLEPLVYHTVDGEIRLSPKRFLTLEDQTETSEPNFSD